MSTDKERDTTELFTRRKMVERQVQSMLARFLAAKRSEIGEASFAHLNELAAKDIFGVRGELEKILVQTANTNQCLENNAYWWMAAALTFLGDSVKGRWPYMGVTQRDNALTNAVASLSDVERLLPLRDDVEPTARPLQNKEADRSSDACAIHADQAHQRARNRG